MTKETFPTELFVSIDIDGADGYLVAHKSLDTIDDGADVMIYATDAVLYRKTTNHGLQSQPQAPKGK